MKKPALFIAPLAVLGVLLVVLGTFFGYRYIGMKSINSFDECAASGYPVMESYPAQCRTPDGRTFVEDVENPMGVTPPVTGGVEIYQPQPDQFIESPLLIHGYAPGTWFWEGTFSIELQDSFGEVIATTHASVVGSDWMTEEPVYFEATLEFEAPSVGNEGVIVLHKANPSGLPENDERISTPIKFKTAQAADGCMITGCSSQLCADEDMVTDCAFREEYACYQGATCERQENGSCGWTMTDELSSCLGE